MERKLVFLEFRRWVKAQSVTVTGNHARFSEINLAQKAIQENYSPKRRIPALLIYLICGCPWNIKSTGSKHRS